MIKSLGSKRGVGAGSHVARACAKMPSSRAMERSALQDRADLMGSML